MAFVLSDCNGRRAAQINENGIDTARIKAEIYKISKMHRDTLLLGSEKGKQLIASGFEDSVVVINNGFEMATASFLAHDLFPGSYDVPEDTKYRFINDNTIMISFKCKMFGLTGRDTTFYEARETDIFVKHNDKWKLSVLILPRSTVSYFKASNYPKSNPALYPSFAGVYQKSDEDADTILNINGSLYASNTTDSKRYKLFSVNDSTFMAEGFPERMIFGNGNNGRITHYTLEYQDGQRRHFPKVK